MGIQTFRPDGSHETGPARGTMEQTIIEIDHALMPYLSFGMRVFSIGLS
jgi:hypothetical protein